MKLTFPQISLMLTLLSKKMQTLTALGPLQEHLFQKGFLVCFKVSMVRAAFSFTWNLKYSFYFIWYPTQYLLSMRLIGNQQLVSEVISRGYR